MTDKGRDWPSGLDSIHLLAGEALKKEGIWYVEENDFCSPPCWQHPDAATRS